MDYGLTERMRDERLELDNLPNEVCIAGTPPKMPKAIYLKVSPWWKRAWHSAWMVLGARVFVAINRGFASKWGFE